MVGRRNSAGWVGWLIVLFMVGLTIGYVYVPADTPPETTAAPADARSVGKAVGALTREVWDMAEVEQERERAQAQASRDHERTPPQDTTPAPTFTDVMLCIRQAESGGNYQAENPTSSASGAWQFIDSTWESVTGLPAPASAYDRATQDAAFLKLWAGGAGSYHWVTAEGCGA